VTKRGDKKDKEGCADQHAKQRAHITRLPHLSLWSLPWLLSGLPAARRRSSADEKQRRRRRRRCAPVQIGHNRTDDGGSRKLIHPYALLLMHACVSPVLCGVCGRAME
jgi:hypothetical protein